MKLILQQHFQKVVGIGIANHRGENTPHFFFRADARLGVKRGCGATCVKPKKWSENLLRGCGARTFSIEMERVARSTSAPRSDETLIVY